MQPASISNADSSSRAAVISSGSEASLIARIINNINRRVARTPKVQHPGSQPVHWKAFFERCNRRQCKTIHYDHDIDLHPCRPCSTVPIDVSSNASAAVISYTDSSNLFYGCIHSNRRHKIYAPCCNLFFSCIYCHNENSDHTLDRSSINQMVCTICLVVRGTPRVQPLSALCVVCDASIERYNCIKCKTIHDDPEVDFYPCHPCQRATLRAMIRNRMHKKIADVDNINDMDKLSKRINAINLHIDNSVNHPLLQANPEQDAILMDRLFPKSSYIGTTQIVHGCIHSMRNCYDCEMYAHYKVQDTMVTYWISITSKEELNTVMDLGFTRRQALKALCCNNFQPDSAIDWLWEHIGEDDWLWQVIGEDDFLDVEEEPQTFSERLEVFRKSGIFDMPELAQSIMALNLCSLLLTSRKYYTPQQHYFCLTCDPNSRQGVCEACARICHADHVLSTVRHSVVQDSQFFCNCDLSENQDSCQARTLKHYLTKASSSTQWGAQAVPVASAIPSLPAGPIPSVIELPQQALGADPPAVPFLIPLDLLPKGVPIDSTTLMPIHLTLCIAHTNHNFWPEPNEPVELNIAETLHDWCLALREKHHFHLVALLFFAVVLPRRTSKRSIKEHLEELYIQNAIPEWRFVKLDLWMFAYALQQRTVEQLYPPIDATGYPQFNKATVVWHADLIKFHNQMMNCPTLSVADFVLVYINSLPVAWFLDRSIQDNQRTDTIYFHNDAPLISSGVLVRDLHLSHGASLQSRTSKCRCGAISVYSPIPQLNGTRFLLLECSEAMERQVQTWGVDCQASRLHLYQYKKDPIFRELHFNRYFASFRERVDYLVVPEFCHWPLLQPILDIATSVIRTATACHISWKEAGQSLLNNSSLPISEPYFPVLKYHQFYVRSTMDIRTMDTATIEYNQYRVEQIKLAIDRLSGTLAAIGVVECDSKEEDSLKAMNPPAKAVHFDPSSMILYSPDPELSPDEISRLQVLLPGDIEQLENLYDRALLHSNPNLIFAPIRSQLQMYPVPLIPAAIQPLPAFNPLLPLAHIRLYFRCYSGIEVWCRAVGEKYGVLADQDPSWVEFLNVRKVMQAAGAQIVRQFPVEKCHWARMSILYPDITAVVLDDRLIDAASEARVIHYKHLDVIRNPKGTVEAIVIQSFREIIVRNPHLCISDLQQLTHSVDTDQNMMGSQTVAEVAKSRKRRQPVDRIMNEITHKYPKLATMQTGPLTVFTSFPEVPNIPLVSPLPAGLCWNKFDGQSTLSISSGMITPNWPLLNLFADDYSHSQESLMSDQTGDSTTSIFDPLVSLSDRSGGLL